MSMWFIGLAGGYGNDSEIIPLKEAVSISPTYALLEMGTGQQTERQWGDRTQAERIPSLPHRLSFTGTRTWESVCFSVSPHS